jgi:hypothetical protein
VHPIRAPAAAREAIAIWKPRSSSLWSFASSSIGVERSASVMSRRAPVAASIPRRTA